MSDFFKNMLIPVDFSDNSEAAVRQAIELACTNGASIHLLHVIKPSAIRSVIPASNQPSSTLSGNYNVKNAMKKLKEWKFVLEESISHCKVNTYVMEGNIYASIQDATKEIGPQLIIIGKNGNHKYFSLFNSVCPNRLAKSTGYPVLTVMSRTVDTKIKIIVIPVGSFIPNRKIELVIEFAKKYRGTIHLVTIPNWIDTEDKNGNSFLETYRILKAGLTSSVEHHILKGNNFPKAILEYAECIGADIIFVNPGTETKISNLTGKQINDALTSSSKLKILSIEPYHHNELARY